MKDSNMKNTYETKEVKIDALITENLQIRVEMQEECVEEYAATFRDRPEDMPPVTVYHDRTNGKFYLADGFHRVIAAKRAERDTITANVHEGTFDDALRFALSANAKHGLRRTEGDKWNAMEIAWQNREKLFGKDKPTVRQLAEICGVSHGYAGKYMSLKPLSTVDKSTPDATTVTRDHLEERNPAIRKQLKEGKDRFGLDIPERLLPVFLTTEPKSFIKRTTILRNELEERVLNDPAFAAIGQRALIDLSNAINTMRYGRPYCVCRACRGEGCDFCLKRGFQTILQYRNLPPEYRAEEV